jgi:hypothetical protein
MTEENRIIIRVIMDKLNPRDVRFELRDPDLYNL